MRHSRIRVALLAIFFLASVAACSEDPPTDSEEPCRSNADCFAADEICSAAGRCVVWIINVPDVREDSTTDTRPDVIQDVDVVNPDVEVLGDVDGDVGNGDVEVSDDAEVIEDTSVDGEDDTNDTTDVADTEDSDDVTDVADTDDAEDSDDVTDATDVGDVSDTDDTDGGEDWVMPPRADTEAPPNDASWRYGGGVGYPDVVDPTWPVVTVVSTGDELLGAMDSAVEGDIIYVDDSARIDLTGKRFCIPGGVWLASGRGRDGSAGAMLYTTEIPRPMISICGDNVRITGLRLYGNDSNECPPEWPDSCATSGLPHCGDCTLQSIAIQSRERDQLEVDNSELAGWTYAGVWIANAGDHKVHHNHIHHNQRHAVGYGVVMTGNIGENVTADVAYNRFDYIRHAVAGSGSPGQDYVARHNLMGEHSIGHIFDMHGEAEGGDPSSTAAGGLIEVYENTVLNTSQPTMRIRGRPVHGAYLYNNCLAQPNASEALKQSLATGNVYADRSPAGSAPNRYGRTASQCETIRWCVAGGGEGPWRYLSSSSISIGSLGFGDFDGDGKTDVFQTTSGTWQFSSAGNTGWSDLNQSDTQLSALKFGDFDGDGVTDVMRSTGDRFEWSRSGTAGWETLLITQSDLDQVALGDFDGDGKTDLFRTTGGEWQWSSGGMESWTRLNNSATTLDKLAFGDFNGDGKTDVFQTSGGKWQYAAGGTGGWIDLNTSSYPLSSLHFGDFDGDGVTDAIRIRSSRVLVSWGSNSSWETLRIASWSIADLAFGDFDGDGVTDVFTTGCL